MKSKSKNPINFESILIAGGLIITGIVKAKNYFERKNKTKILCRNLAYCFQEIFSEEDVKMITQNQFGKINRLTNDIYSIQLSNSKLMKIFSEKQDILIDFQKNEQEIQNYKKEINFITDWLSNLKNTAIAQDLFYKKILSSGLCSHQMFNFSPDNFEFLRKKIGLQNEE